MLATGYKFNNPRSTSLHSVHVQPLRARPNVPTALQRMADHLGVEPDRFASSKALGRELIECVFISGMSERAQQRAIRTIEAHKAWVHSAGRLHA